MNRLWLHASTKVSDYIFDSTFSLQQMFYGMNFAQSAGDACNRCLRGELSRGSTCRLHFWLRTCIYTYSYKDGLFYIISIRQLTVDKVSDILTGFAETTFSTIKIVFVLLVDRHVQLPHLKSRLKQTSSIFIKDAFSQQLPLERKRTYNHRT